MNRTDSSLGLRSGSLPVLILAALAIGFALSSTPLRAQVPPFTGMVAFGDSLSDGGNMNFVVSGFGEPQAQWLTGFDPNYYYNYRFSNGPVWVDHLYADLGFGLIGDMRPNGGVHNMDGTNFSWAGSRSGSGTYGGIFPNLLLQVDTYSAQVASGTSSLPAPEATLFTIWSGANDVFEYVEYGDPITPAQVAGNIVMSISTLYDEGGRYFLVPNLPPIGLIPSYIDDPIKGQLAAEFVDAFNDELAFALEGLSENLEGITIFELDVHKLFLDIMSDPAAYGFTNITDTAYIRYGEEPYVVRDPPYGELAPNSEGYFYWDAVHGTTAVNALIAEAAYQAVVPEPSTLGLIVAGLGIFARGRKPLSRTS